MKNIVLALSLVLFSFGASAQLAPIAPESETRETVTSTELCMRIGRFIPSLLNNKLGDATKEAQIAYMESRFEELPHMKMFEPALLKMLDALYDTDVGKAITMENARETAPIFLRATLIACIREEARGWIQEVPGVVEFERVEPDETPTEQAPPQRFKRPSMSKELSI